MWVHILGNCLIKAILITVLWLYNKYIKKNNGNKKASINFCSSKGTIKGIKRAWINIYIDLTKDSYLGYI